MNIAQLGSQIVKRCRHCNHQLRRVPVQTTVLRSPFSKDDPATLCPNCDAPGQLPVVPHA